jgi:hypothetical protein
MGEVDAAGRVLGLQTRRLAATITRGLDAASATIGEHRDDAVSILNRPALRNAMQTDVRLPTGTY